jgi:hypothetical protein
VAAAAAAADLFDQFAIKPTGSTECALIDCIDFVTLLEFNHFARCVMTNFLRLLIMADHAVVVRKLKLLDILASIITRIIFFLIGHSGIMILTPYF